MKHVTMMYNVHTYKEAMLNVRLSPTYLQTYLLTRKVPTASPRTKRFLVQWKSRVEKI